MSWLAQLDYRIWILIAASSLLCYGLLVVVHYRSLKRMGRQIAAIAKRAHELDGFAENDQRIDQKFNELVVVVDQCRQKIALLKYNMAERYSNFDADLHQIAETVIRIDERTTHCLTREHLSNVPSKSAFYTLRTDLEKLNAEVQNLHHRREIQNSDIGNPGAEPLMSEKRSSRLDQRRSGLPIMRPDAGLLQAPEPRNDGTAIASQTSTRPESTASG